MFRLRSSGIELTSCGVNKEIVIIWCAARKLGARTTLAICGWCVAMQIALAQPAASTWPMRGGDQQHTGRVDVSILPIPQVEWEVSPGTGGKSSAGAAIDTDGQVYVGTDDGIAKYRPDGTEVWSYSWGETMYATPAIATDGTVYAAPRIFSDSSAPGLYAFNSDGTIKWQFTGTSGSARVLSSPMIGNDGTVYFAVANDGVYALNPDGTQKWLVNDGHYYIGSPVLSIDGSRLYANDDNLALRAIDTASGTVAWGATVRDGSRSSPAVLSDGTIVLGDDRNKVRAFDPDGNLLWTYPGRGGSFANDFFGSPAIASDDTILIIGTDGYLYALNPDGSLRWEKSDPSFTIATPTLDRYDHIYVNGVDEFTCWTIDGDLRWTLSDIDGRISQPAIAADGSIYARNEERFLVKITATPEPSTLALLSMGAVGLLAYAWRKRRR